MIIRRTDSALLLVTQPDHAALARRVMESWVTEDLGGARRQASILHAVAEHDNGWREVDAAPLVDVRSGRLLDFVNAPSDVRQGVWPRGIGRLAGDPFAAALVAEHAIQIYRRLWNDAAWAPFFARMEGLRATFAHAAEVTVQDIQRDYFFVGVADLISLTFCDRWNEAIEWRGYTVHRDGETVTISPDPFAGVPVPLEVDARQMPSRPYASAEDATSAFRASPHVLIHGVARG